MKSDSHRDRLDAKRGRQRRKQIMAHMRYATDPDALDWAEVACGECVTDESRDIEREPCGGGFRVVRKRIGDV